MLSMIAAMSENRVIGRDGGLPWHLPADLRFFKRTTEGHPVIMGRKTFESMDGPLPKRFNIVITRRANYEADGAVVARTLDEAIEAARDAAGGDSDEIFITGGAKIYELGLPIADRMYLTTIHAEVEGDTFFPEFDLSAWSIVHEEHHPADDRHAHAMTFRTLDRRTAS